MQTKKDPTENREALYLFNQRITGLGRNTPNPSTENRFTES